MVAGPFLFGSIGVDHEACLRHMADWIQRPLPDPPEADANPMATP
jgi:hypothetical protein